MPTRVIKCNIFDVMEKCIIYRVSHGQRSYLSLSIYIVRNKLINAISVSNFILTKHKMVEIRNTNPDKHKTK